MGREQQAKEERAKEREELKAAFLQESLGRLDELAETQERHKKTINQQGRALEALANVITSMRGELAALEIAVQPFYRRWTIAAWRYWLSLLAVGHAAIEKAERQAYGPSLKVAKRVIEPAGDQESSQAEAMLEARELEQLQRQTNAMAPAVFDHIHQYEKDGPFVYACTVPGCGRRADLETIASEAAYLAAKGTVDADQSSTKL